MPETDDGPLSVDVNTYGEIDLIDDLIDYGVIIGHWSIDAAMVFRLALPLIT
jgi:hypothetical protein